MRCVASFRRLRTHAVSACRASSTTTSSKSRSTRKKKSSSRQTTPHKRWKGLNQRRVTSETIAFTDLQQIALDNTLRGLCQQDDIDLHRMNVLLNEMRTRTGLHRLSPNGETVGYVIQQMAAKAGADPNVEAITNNGADVAVECMMRCTDMWGVKEDEQVLKSVIKEGMRDSVVANRAERALSVLKYVRGKQMRVSSSLMFEVFRMCVMGLEVGKAAVVMDFVEQCGLLSQGNHRETDYLNGVMFAAVVSGDVNTAQVVVEEMDRRGIEWDVQTKSNMIGLRVRKGEGDEIRDMFEDMREKGGSASAVGFAGWIEVLGRRKDKKQVMQVVREYLEKRQSGVQGLYEDRKGGVDEMGKLLKIRADPVGAGFAALRVCGGGTEAIELLEELKSRTDGWQTGWLVEWLAFEACVKEGRIDLAKQIRRV